MMQVPAAADTGAGRPSDDQSTQQIQLTPPGPERIFGRLDTEKEFQERMKQEGLERSPADRVAFPMEPIVTTKSYARRQFAPITEFVEPNYLSFGRLYFEQKNFERFGWDLGILAPGICVGKFFWDTALLPYHLGTQPFRKFDSNAGQCLPGDPVPLVLYPPEISVTGAVLEATTLISLFAIFASP